MILALFLSLFLQTPVRPDQPNVIVVVLDDVGAQDIIPNSLTPTIDTPTLDAIASRGLTMRRAYAQPVCETARYGMMFGMYGETAGSVCFGPDANTPDTSWNSLPKIFEILNYNTAFFGKWHLGGNSVGAPWELTPNLHGFDYVGAGIPSNLAAENCGESYIGSYSNWLRFQNGLSFTSQVYNTIAIRNKFMEWWLLTQGPKFALVSFQAAHAPFHEPPSELLPHVPQGGPGYTASRIRFEKMVISIDTILLQFHRQLDLSNTYIIIIGDNGTPPNAIGPGQNSSKVKTTVYEGGVNVPLLIVGPNIPAGSVSDAIVSIVDLPATLAALIGIDMPFVDSQSFKNILENPTLPGRGHAFVHHVADTLGGTQKQRAVIQDQFKLIRLGAQELFFDLLNDPDESTPLSTTAMDPLVVQSLRDQMQIYIDRGF